MKDIADELINLKFKETDTLEDCLDMFYSVMRKHGIKKWSTIPTRPNKCDWIMCWALFLDQVRLFFEFTCCIDHETPEDLQY